MRRAKNRGFATAHAEIWLRVGSTRTDELDPEDEGGQQQRGNDADELDDGDESLVVAQPSRRT